MVQLMLQRRIQKFRPTIKNLVQIIGQLLMIHLQFRPLRFQCIVVAVLWLGSGFLIALLLSPLLVLGYGICQAVRLIRQSPQFQQVLFQFRQFVKPLFEILKLSHSLVELVGAFLELPGSFRPTELIPHGAWNSRQQSTRCAQPLGSAH